MNKQLVAKFSGTFRSVRSAFRDDSLREALFVFCSTRLVILVIAITVGQTVVNLEGKQFFHDVLDPSTLFTKAPIGRHLRHAMARGDAGWYCAVAENGYEHEQFDASAQHKWAFFPLYPLILRTARLITGECLVTGAVLSNVFFFLTLVLLHKLVLEWGFETAIADRTVLYLAIYPTSYFFSLTFTESLFVLLTVSAFLAAVRDRWWAVAVIGALASATRSSGVLLVPALAVYNVLRYRSWRPQQLLPVLLIPAGLLSFMVYLKFITGNAFAFRDVQIAWGRQPAFFLSPLWAYLSNPGLAAAPWNPLLLNFLLALFTFVAGFFLLKRREWSLGTYTLLSLILPLSSGSLQSMGRYISVVFPIFIALAIWGRSAKMDQTIRLVFITLWALLTALWAAHVSWALS